MTAVDKEALVAEFTRQIAMKRADAKRVSSRAQVETLGIQQRTLRDALEFIRALPTSVEVAALRERNANLRQTCEDRGRAMDAAETAATRLRQERDAAVVAAVAAEAEVAALKAMLDQAHSLRHRVEAEVARLKVLAGALAVCFGHTEYGRDSGILLVVESRVFFDALAKLRAALGETPTAGAVQEDASPTRLQDADGASPSEPAPAPCGVCGGTGKERTPYYPGCAPLRACSACAETQP